MMAEKRQNFLLKKYDVAPLIITPTVIVTASALMSSISPARNHRDCSGRTRWRKKVATTAKDMNTAAISKHTRILYSHFSSPNDNLARAFLRSSSVSFSGLSGSDGSRFCGLIRISSPLHDMLPEIISNNVVRDKTSKLFSHDVNDGIPGRPGLMRPSRQRLGGKTAKFAHNGINQGQNIVRRIVKLSVMSGKAFAVLDVPEYLGKNRAKLPCARVFVTQPGFEFDQRTAVTAIQKFLDLRIVVVQPFFVTDAGDLGRDADACVFHGGFSQVGVEKLMGRVKHGVGMSVKADAAWVRMEAALWERALLAPPPPRMEQASLSLLEVSS
jgi:hypothetical protein